MKKIILDNQKKIIKEKNILEKELNVKISNKDDGIYIDGLSENEYLAEKVIDAINFGFSTKRALLIKKKNLMFEILNIKNYMRGKNIVRIKSRIVGEGGRALMALSQLSDCYIEIKGNQVGIIGDPENIENAQNAIIMLIKGSKHANVYAFLERSHPEPILDFGLREVKKN
ncbi:hypothetical protein HYS72_01860 [Candidatus Pacearchaeota archaeon]|nr:hypothetical protein [Candidatus Pacearchaeota archaeon]MBI2057087.1 hypothetical protein [Candidatus Pacearchaeota archaeon]